MIDGSLSMAVIVFAFMWMFLYKLTKKPLTTFDYVVLLITSSGMSLVCTTTWIVFKTLLNFIMN